MSHKRKTVDVETAGATVELHKVGEDTLNLRVDADGAISGTLHVNDREGTADAFEENTYSSTSDIDDTGRDVTEPYAIFEVTTGTGTADDTADVLLSGGGGGD